MNKVKKQKNRLNQKHLTRKSAVKYYQYIYFFNQLKAVKDQTGNGRGDQRLDFLLHNTGENQNNEVQGTMKKFDC